MSTKNEAAEGGPTETAIQEKVGNFAEAIGRTVGNFANDAEAWLGQRDEIAKQLRAARDQATAMLQRLGLDEVPFPRSPGRRGRPAGSKNKAKTAAAPAKRGPGRPKGSGKKKRHVSEATKAKMAAAQRARWEARKKGGEVGNG